MLLVHGPVAACTPAGCQSDDADPGTGRLNSRVEFEAPSAGEVSISLYNNGAFGAEQHYWLVAEEIGAAAQAPLGGTGRVAGLAAPLVLPTLPPPAPEGGVAFRLRLDLAGVSE